MERKACYFIFNGIDTLSAISSLKNLISTCYMNIYELVEFVMMEDQHLNILLWRTFNKLLSTWVFQWEFSYQHCNLCYSWYANGSICLKNRFLTSRMTKDEKFKKATDAAPRIAEKGEVKGKISKKNNNLKLTVCAEILRPILCMVQNIA